MFYGRQEMGQKVTTIGEAVESRNPREIARFLLSHTMSAYEETGKESDGSDVVEWAIRVGTEKYQKGDIAGVHELGSFLESVLDAIRSLPEDQRELVLKNIRTE